MCRTICIELHNSPRQEATSSSSYFFDHYHDRQNFRTKNEHWRHYETCIKRECKDAPGCIGSSTAETRSSRERDHSSSCCKLRAKHFTGGPEYYPKRTKRADCIPEVRNAILALIFSNLFFEGYQGMWSTALFHYSRVWLLQTAAQHLRYLPKLHVRLSPPPVDVEFFWQVESEGRPGDDRCSF